MIKPCDGKSVHEVRENINTWYFVSLWPADPGRCQGWFESSKNILTTALGRMCEQTRPSGLARPNPLAGLTTAELLAETAPTFDAILQWTQTAEAYAECVHSKLSSTCRDLPRLRTVRHAGERLATHSSEVPVNPSAPRLCQYYTKWARRFYDWTVAFAEWEQSIVDCLTRSLADDDNRDYYPLGTKQISPVPWPPWPDVDPGDEV